MTLRGHEVRADPGVSRAFGIGPREVGAEAVRRGGQQARQVTVPLLAGPPATLGEAFPVPREEETVDLSRGAGRVSKRPSSTWRAMSAARRLRDWARTPPSRARWANPGCEGASVLLMVSYFGPIGLLGGWELLDQDAGGYLTSAIFFGSTWSLSRSAVSRISRIGWSIADLNSSWNPEPSLRSSAYVVITRLIAPGSFSGPRTTSVRSAPAAAIPRITEKPRLDPVRPFPRRAEPP